MTKVLYVVNMEENDRRVRPRKTFSRQIKSFLFYLVLKNIGFLTPRRRSVFEKIDEHKRSKRGVKCGKSWPL